MTIKQKANKKHAKHVDLYVREYAKVNNNGDLEATLSDFLADMMHWAEHNGLDFHEHEQRATGHYVAECRGEY